MLQRALLFLLIPAQIVLFWLSDRLGMPIQTELPTGSSFTVVLERRVTDLSGHSSRWESVDSGGWTARDFQGTPQAIRWAEFPLSSIYSLGEVPVRRDIRSSREKKLISKTMSSFCEWIASKDQETLEFRLSLSSAEAPLLSESCAPIRKEGVHP